MSTPTAAQPAGRTVDLNADLGEGLGVWRLTDDDGLLEVVSSANVACGAHAGDPTHMRRVCRRAAERGVAVGAQVSYPDLLGFGRRFVDIDPAELEDSVLYQLSALQGVARAEGTQVRYVKPHGALYNAVVTHEAQAAAVVAAVVAGAPGTAVLGLPGAVWLEQAEEAGLRPVHEVFADRAYTAEGTLVPRGEPGAVVHDTDEVVRRSLQMVLEGSVVAVDGSSVAVDAASVCVHGDTPGAVDIARRVHDTLVDAGVRVAPFA